MPNELTRLPAPQNRAADLVKQRLEVFTRILPAGITADQFAIEAMIAANELESNVNPDSVKVAVFNAASCGLRLSRQLGQAYLVPFKGHVQLIVGYKGYIELGYASGWLTDVICEVVLRGEEYRRWNNAQGPQIEHELPPERDREWSNVVATYCQYWTKSGRCGIDTCGLKELQKLYKKGGVWSTYPVAMALKTPIRRAAKLWKQTDRLAAAIHLDELAERNEPQPALVPDAEPAQTPMSLDDIPDEPTPDAGPTKLDGLRDIVRIAETPFEVDNAVNAVHVALERGDINTLEHGQLIRELESKTKNRRKA